MKVEIKMPKVDIESIDRELIDCKVTAYRVYSDVFIFEGMPHRAMLDMVAEDDYSQMILYRETPSEIEKGVFHLEEVFFTEPRYENISEEWELYGENDDIVFVTISPKETPLITDMA